MADAVFTIADAFSPQVLVPQVEQYYLEKSALFTAGLSVDVTSMVGFNLGGNKVTRPIFKGGLTAQDLDTTAETDNETQEPVYDYEEIPIASKIIPVSFTGSGLEDALRTPGVYNDIVRNVARVWTKTVDGLLVSNSVSGTDWGAEGVSSSYTLDITGESVKSLTWDHLVDAKALFLDTQNDPMVLVMHSMVAKKLIKTSDVKNALNASAVRDGFVFNLLGMPCMIADNVKVDGVNYHSYLVKAGALGYAWKRQFGVKEVYKGNDVTQIDFTVRVAVMRNYISGIEPIVKIISL